MRAGLGGAFNHTSKLKVIKFKETKNEPDSKKSGRKKSKMNTLKW